ncbi:hypothetical protein Dda_6639 [Drechslerella dactyloides]|uniref:Uncharacterized protein n=1 Tax=Drechslerella dactyloides TaxID=74499 RepID=A0AAD6NJ34_DREDA|nr:hypothetical protein Dda_6639 [Drechslerella dactyloides]
MKAGFVSAAFLAFLYTSPVLAVAVALPQEPSEEIIVDNPNSEVIDVQSSDSTPPAPDTDLDDFNIPPAITPGEDQGAYPENPSDEVPPAVDTGAEPAPPADTTGADVAPSAAVVPMDPDLALPAAMPIAITAEDGTSALASLNDESNSTVTTDALSELAGAQMNIDQMAQTVAMKAYEVAQAQDVHSMDITFQGERGKLGTKLPELPQNEDGSLQNIDECQSSTMEWIDNTPVDTTSLSLGGTFTNGVNALLYRDQNCMERIDQGAPWPDADLTFKQGDRITFWFKLLGLSEAQLKGTAPMPNGVTLPPL